MSHEPSAMFAAGLRLHTAPSCFFLSANIQPYSKIFSHVPQNDHERPEAGLGQSRITVVVSRNLDALTHVIDHQLRHELRKNFDCVGRECLST